MRVCVGSAAGSPGTGDPQPALCRLGLEWEGFDMVLKIVAAVILIWLAFVLLGWVFKALGTLLLIAAVVTVGAVAYGAIKGRSNQRQIKP
jgi:hypothetical protein